MADPDNPMMFLKVQFLKIESDYLRKSPDPTVDNDPRFSNNRLFISNLEFMIVSPYGAFVN
jgi:hypothetical protein